MKEEKDLFFFNKDEEKELGCIGYLRGDFGGGGKEFWTTWFPHNFPELNDEKFKEAQAVGFVEGRYLCFEEDCDSPVAIRELLDKGLMKAPVNQYYKEGEYSAIIDDVIATWHKDDYLKAVEARNAAEQNHTASEPKQKKVKDKDKHRIISEQGERHHICEANASYRR